jgi:[ribosomal protein S5]-alanine N-acetyltransferase
LIFTLLPLSKLQLESLAASQVPDEFRLRAELDSLPPSFVAARNLKLAEQAPPGPWSTTFLIVRNSDGRVIGACGFKTAPDAGRVEAGYGVSPSSRRTGAATIALNKLTQLAFEAGATEVLAEILPDNLASIRVVQKAGFSQIGDRVDEDGDYVVQWLCRRIN